MEAQQLEFTIISFLDILTSGAASASTSFDLFASKTFGNLVNEMKKHKLLESLADDMRSTKARRDFSVHKFLFHRYGGELLTNDAEYELLVREANNLGLLFAESRTKFHDLMLQSAPIDMFGVRSDPATGALIVVESEFTKGRHGVSGRDGRGTGVR
jgi:hypothetical protein